MTCRFQALRSWVHEWHETDGALTACGLPAADERLASDDGQADCPGCLEVLAGERRAANAERAREARGALEESTAAVGRTVLMWRRSATK